MNDITCNKCGHGINIHSPINGCQHVETISNFDCVCECWRTPQDVAAAEVKRLETNTITRTINMSCPYCKRLLEIDLQVSARGEELISRRAAPKQNDTEAKDG